MNKHSKKVWFITRSYPPQPGGGPFVRKQIVDFLIKNNYDVQVITLPQANTVEKNVTMLSPGLPYKITRALEKLGFAADYLFSWSSQVRKYLEKNAQQSDLVFATSGGELGFFNEVRRLKQNRPDLFVILNYHDVLDYGIYRNSKVYNDYHLNIDKNEFAAIESANLIFAQSESMTNILKEKFPDFQNKITYFYFGFTPPSIIKQKSSFSKNTITIAYMGAMGPIQSPEILIKAYKELPANYQDKIKIQFIGNSTGNKIISNSDEKIEKINYIPRDQLLERLKDKIDISFFSAIDIPTLEPLMPTKFYENIGMNIPMIAAIPTNSESLNLIHRHHLGWAFPYNDVSSLVQTLKSIADNPEILHEIHHNITAIRDQFQTDQTMQKLTSTIEIYYEKFLKTQHESI